MQTQGVVGSVPRWSLERGRTSQWAAHSIVAANGREEAGPLAGGGRPARSGSSVLGALAGGSAMTALSRVEAAEAGR